MRRGQHGSPDGSRQAKACNHGLHLEVGLQLADDGLCGLIHAGDGPFLQAGRGFGWSEVAKWPTWVGLVIRVATVGLN